MATQIIPRNALEVSVANFDGDPCAAREQIRALMEADLPSFQEGVVRVLQSSSSSRGIQYVTGLLVRGNHLFGALSNPSLSQDERVLLARTALQVDSLADVNLAKRLATEAAQIPSAVASRLMAVLEEISSGHRIMPSLLRLMRVSDPQIRSKAVLMIGRASGSVQWVRSRLSDPDPRTRASAIEALWGCEDAEVRDVLLSAARDSNNRVAGNALFALYKFGETSCIPELLKMAVSEAPLFRASAAWAMGETRDRRFADALARMMSDPNPMVRKRAFWAMGRIRSAKAEAVPEREWRITARLLPSLGNARQLLADAGPSGRGPKPKLAATQFVLTESGQVIYNYQVEERRPPETLAVTFLLPRESASGIPPWMEGAANCLAWKRPSDLWRIVHFLEGEPLAEPRPPLPPFTSNPKTAAAAIERPPGKAGCGDFWGSLRDCVRAANAAARGARRLIVYCPYDPGIPEDAPEIVSAAMTAQFVTQAVSGSHNATLEELCRRTRGKFQIAASEISVAPLLEDAYQMLLARFLVSYLPAVPGAESLHIWVSNSTGWGETTVML